MRCSDIKRAVIESKFVDENFVKNIIIRGNRITHKNWETSSCYIKNDVLYAIAGCTKEANKKGCVNQFINIVKLPANGTFIIDNMFFYRSDSIGRVSSILLVAENNLRERTAAGKDNQERAKKKGSIITDEGGHIIANCLGGPNEAINIVPLDRDLNRKISHFESGIKENCVGDFSLNYHVHLRYPDEFSFRPCRLSYYAYLESNNTKFVLSLDVSQ